MQNMRQANSLTQTARESTVMSSLVFGLDFDDTFTADPELWAMFIREAQAKGHRVYCVTARRNSDENIEILSETFANHALEIPIVFCNL